MTDPIMGAEQRARAEAARGFMPIDEGLALHAAALTAPFPVPHLAAVHPSVSHSVNPPAGWAAKRYRPHGDHRSVDVPATPDAMDVLAPVPTSHTATALLSADPAASSLPHGDQHTQSYGRPPAKSPSRRAPPIRNS